MLRIDVIAVGRLRDDALNKIWNDYTVRMKWTLALHEIEESGSQTTEKRIESKLSGKAFIIALDERGKNLRSAELAEKLEKLSVEGKSHIQFIIGAADGLPENIKNRTDLLLAFGAQTWPHMMVRIMLAEQLYRAQQILAGHPYHRE